MLDHITQAFALTQAILNAAEQQHWDKVESLQQRREQLLKQTESLPAPEDKPTSLQVAQLINDIKAIDNRITPLLQQHRQALIKQKLQTNKGQKMTKAYKST
ncbi:flagellar protein FliT [Amphritea sp. 1_MG-2023]|uniref:flagellar protein FliT n=1 Tax=Amphritea sp. 1_MG-2023 TaxID=3062670 RepID=UPI0026E3214A|nr:flagellar protein FliT [Amphritea sp. 1_MG-2023]MDO6564700.1 flagellar protein FliT [Amphritea sp. 1_MG-2023]